MSRFLLYALYTLIGLAGVNFIVVIHEMGHMICARLFSVDIEVMQLGFGKPVFSKIVRKIRYSIGIIPFGGFCRMKASRFEKGSLYSISALKRFLIYLCGPLLNFFLCFVCYFVFSIMPKYVYTTGPQIALASDYAAFYGTGEFPATDSGLLSGDTVYSVDGKSVNTFYYISYYLEEDYKNKKNAVINTSSGTFTLEYEEGKAWGLLPFPGTCVFNIQEGSPEFNAGLRDGDIIRKVNGNECKCFIDILLYSGKSRIVSVEAERNGLLFTVSFPASENGLSFSPCYFQQKITGMPPVKAASESLMQMLGNTKAMLFSLKSIIKGKADNDSFAGVFSASYRMGSRIAGSFSHGLINGIRAICFITGSVSLSIAVANMLPIPALDGGFMLVSLTEAITGRTLDSRIYTILQITGLVCISILLILVNFTLP